APRPSEPLPSPTHDPGGGLDGGGPRLGAGSQLARPTPWQKAQNSALERSLQLSGKREKSLCQGLRAASGGRPPDPGPRPASGPSLPTPQPETASDQPAQGSSSHKARARGAGSSGLQVGSQALCQPLAPRDLGGCMAMSPQNSCTPLAGCTMGPLGTTKRAQTHCHQRKTSQAPEGGAPHVSVLSGGGLCWSAQGFRHGWIQRLHQPLGAASGVPSLPCPSALASASGTSGPQGR
ncbi:hypothetical protein H1C71_003688, partial [Ictidomys tridecemlineatus]